MFPCSTPLTVIEQESALENESALAARFLASDSERIILDIAAAGVDDIYPAKTGGNSAVGNGGDLQRLPFAAAERATQEIFLFAAYPVASVPEVDRVALVNHVAKHLPQFAILNLIKDLPAELEIIPLLVDAPAPIANNVDAIFDIRN